MSDEAQITPVSTIIEFGFLIAVLIILPSFVMYYQLFNTEIREVMIQQLGWNWVIGTLGFSFAGLSIGGYIFVRKIIFALIRLHKLKNQYKNSD